jgi:hypothetical protein
MIITDETIRLSPISDQVEREGSYTAAHSYRKKQEKFAQSGRVKKKAREAADALDGEEGPALEKARQSSKAGPKGKH